MDMIILTFIVAEPSNCTDFISTPFIPFLPSLERRLRKHRRMQKPQMPRIMRAMRMKMATTPHPGMPVFSPMKSAACIVLSWTFVRVDTVEDSTVEDSSVKHQNLIKLQKCKLQWNLLPSGSVDVGVVGGLVCLWRCFPKIFVASVVDSESSSISSTSGASRLNSLNPGAIFSTPLFSFLTYLDQREAKLINFSKRFALQIVCKLSTTSFHLFHFSR